jgi:hypothetical protein
MLWVKMPRQRLPPNSPRGNSLVKKIFAAAFVALTLLIALTACSEINYAQNTAETQETPNPPAAQYETPPADTATPIPEPEPVPEQPHEWTIEELGETIVSAGMFWEEWWEMRGRFAYVGDEWLESPEHSSAIYQRLSPASGFGSLDDIRNYLLQYYTEAWIDAELELSDGLFPAFVEYNDRLYMHSARAGFPRPNWETADHTFIGQDTLLGEGINRTVVDTTVLHGSWHREASGGYAYPRELRYRFTFINGRIDSFGERCACGEDYADEVRRRPTPPMNIHEIFPVWQGPDADFPHEEHEANIAEFLYRFGFENVRTVTYTQRETDWYGTIILWPDSHTPLRNFSVVSLDVAGHDWDENGQLIIDTQEVLLYVPILRHLQLDAVVLNVAFSHYLLPHGAIIFTDELGVQWRMFIVECMRGGCCPIFHLGQAHEFN